MRLGFYNFWGARCTLNSCAGLFQRGDAMENRDLYAEAFTLAWEHIEEMGAFSEDERALGYEPMKTKVYELIEAGETDPLILATDALAWFRDQAQISQSAGRVFKRVSNN
jgi:hypothetical protein